MLRMTVKHSVFSSRASFMMARVTHSRLDEGPKVRVMKPFMPVKSRPSGNERSGGCEGVRGEGCECGGMCVCVGGGGGGGG